MIGISGELEQQTWKAQDGSNRSKVIIKLQNLTFIDKKDSNSQPQNGYNQATQQPQQTYQHQQSTQQTQPQQYQQPQQQSYQPQQQMPQQQSYRPQQQTPQQPPVIDINEDNVPFLIGDYK